MKLTDAAAEQIIKVAKDSETEPIVRAGVKGGGCFIRVGWS